MACASSLAFTECFSQGAQHLAGDVGVVEPAAAGAPCCIAAAALAPPGSGASSGSAGPAAAAAARCTADGGEGDLHSRVLYQHVLRGLGIRVALPGLHCSSSMMQQAIVLVDPHSSHMSPKGTSAMGAPHRLHWRAPRLHGASTSANCMRTPGRPPPKAGYMMHNEG